MLIKPFDPKTATETEWDGVYQHILVMHAEAWPDDPVPPREQIVRGWTTESPLWQGFRFAAWQGATVVGMGGGWVGRTGDNEHLIDVGVDVLPDFRRQGIGKRLLSEVVDVARRENRRLMIFGTADIQPAGEVIMRHIGAEPGMTSHLNQLTLTDLDPALMRRWIERAEERAVGYSIGEWGDHYPDEDIEAIARMYDVVNDAPRENLQIEDEHRTPDQLRQMEDSRIKRGTERWSMYIREEATGVLAGFTEVFWSPYEPETLGQGWTAVLPQYRNLGLGRWLKAAMIEKVLRERPQVKRVRTGNADSNGPMLAINHEMGFKPYRAWTVWQIDTDKVAAYLAGERELAVVM